MLLLLILAGTLAPVVVLANRSAAPSKPPLPVASEEEVDVGALGRIEPQSKVLKVNAPSVMEPSVVEKLMVDVGDQVKAGDVLAVLDNNRREQADLAQAKAALIHAERVLAKVKAGAKAGNIDAQAAAVVRTKEQLALAEKQLARYRSLRRDNNSAIAEQDLDIRITDVDVLRNQLAEHEASLVALREVRAVDVEEAEANVELQKAAIERAEAELETSVIRSPIDGEVLRINSRVGERIGGPEGLLDLGDTREMDVIAEVHESDILKVRLGQPAQIFLRNLNVTLEGHVIELGRLIGRKDVLSTDPVDDTDARVMEVTIRLKDEHGEMVSGMSFAKVEVTINTSPDSVSSAEVSSNNKSSVQE